MCPACRHYLRFDAGADASQAPALTPLRIEGSIRHPAILLALKPEYAGDRVFAFGVGLASMVFLAYNEKTEFYLTDMFCRSERQRSAEQCRIAKDLGSKQKAGDG